MTNSPHYQGFLDPPYTRVFTDLITGVALDLTGCVSGSFTLTMLNQDTGQAQQGIGVWTIANQTTNKGQASYQWTTNDMATPGYWMVYTSVKLPSEPGPRAFDPDPISIFSGLVGAGAAPPGVLPSVTPTSQLPFLRIRDFGGISDGITECTGAFQRALAALPTVTVYANPNNNTGASATYPVGTIELDTGTYKVGTSGDIGNIGPFVNIIGPGHTCCKLDYHGSGDALRIYNAVNPSSGTFDTSAGYTGRLDGFLIDGTNAGAGAVGLHYGDAEGGVLGPDLHIFNFSGAGSKGLYMDNSVSWTENTWGRVVIGNCTTAVYFNVSTVSASNSFEYNDLLFKLYCYPNQNGIVLDNGVLYSNGSLRVFGNFALSSSAQSNAALTITGRVGGVGQPTQITYSRLDIQVETDLTGANAPQTIKFGDVSNNAIYNCIGVLSFIGTWAHSNWSVNNSFAAGNFTFMGQVAGDTNIAPSVNGAFACVGALIYSLSEGFTTGMPLSAGDFFSLTLSANATVNFQRNTAGPQRKTFVFQQAASGGPYTVTWPKPGSPTVNSPAVYWAGGVAPTMSTGANAIDKYFLETLDGVHWYGTAVQNLS